jgi:hypothetical protein
MEGVDPMSTTEHVPETVKQTHPVRGVLWGLLVGIGLACLLAFVKAISLSLAPMIIVAALGTVAGVVWSIYGPAKAPKDPPPEFAQTSSPPPPLSDAVDG